MAQVFNLGYTVLIFFRLLINIMTVWPLLQCLKVSNISSVFVFCCCFFLIFIFTCS